jgi:uncharacterized membrane protein
MLEGLKLEMSRLIDLQLVVSILFIIAGNIVLPRIGISLYSLRIFNLMVLSAFNTAIIQVIMIILLYFEDRRGAFLVTCMFFVTSGAFTYLTFHYGESYLGYGYFAASLLTLLIGLMRVNYYLGNLDYYMYNNQCYNDASK